MRLPSLEIVRFKAGLRAADRQGQAETRAQADWHRVEDVRAWRRARAARKRERAAAASGGRCTNCQDPLESPRSLVLSAKECRPCVASRPYRAGRPVKASALFKEELPHWVLDGAALRRARVESGVTQAEFAAKAGWAQSRQSYLEADRYIRVQERTAATLDYDKRFLSRDAWWRYDTSRGPLAAPAALAAAFCPRSAYVARQVLRGARRLCTKDRDAFLARLARVNARVKLDAGRLATAD